MSENFKPFQITPLDISQPLPVLTAGMDTHGRPYTRTRLIVRWGMRPVGRADAEFLDGQLLPNQYQALVWTEIQSGIKLLVEEAREDMPSELPLTGIPLSTNSPYHSALAETPFISVIICTRDRTADLQKCLPSLLAMDYPAYEVIVVDNAPTTEATRAYVQQMMANHPHLHYVLAQQAGLSVARNVGLAQARGEIVAFTDDDALAEPTWLKALALHFTGDAQVGCVTGLTLPAELETEAQLFFEQFGGFNKGRGFIPMRFSLATHRGKEPLFPYLAAKFGSGVNMAFRTEVLRRLGGFDEALGAGTLTGGAEDIDAYFRVIMDGQTLVYEPAALLFHYHRRDYAGLRKQLGNNGTAFGAFVMKCLWVRPLRLLYLLAQIPYTIYYLFNPTSPRNEHKQEEYPKDLTQNELWGMLRGPLLYIRSRRRLHQARLQNAALPVNATGEV